MLVAKLLFQTASQSSTTSWKPPTSVPGNRCVTNPRDKRKTLSRECRCTYYTLVCYQVSSDELRVCLSGRQVTATFRPSLEA
jgi:hypothetical protein